MGPNADKPLSNDEQAFYLDHVRTELGAEFEAIVKTLAAIADGVDRPDSLTEHVGEMHSDWSQSKASTIRSGLVSRMHELGLVERERVGQRGIAYTLTHIGEDLLSDQDAVQQSR